MSREGGAVTTTPPPAEGTRRPFADLPVAVRRWGDEVLGEPIVEAVTQPGGFSPGVAARVRGASGSRMFVKAVSDEVNAETPEMHRKEARNAAALPVTAPVPRLRASYDDGTWVALAFDDVDGRHPVLPWERGELLRVLATLDDLLDHLTPSPVPDAPEVGPQWRSEFDSWRMLAAGDLPAGLDRWAARQVGRLAALEGEWEAAAQGDSLLHLDLRADNLLVTPERVWVVDWPWAARGAPLFDLVAFAPSVAMQGGPEPAELLGLTRHGRAADRDVLVRLVAAVAGYFHVHALQPPPPGLPTVREFQRAQGEVALRWLADLTGW